MTFPPRNSCMAKVRTCGTLMFWKSFAGADQIRSGCTSTVRIEGPGTSESKDSSNCDSYNPGTYLQSAEPRGAHGNGHGAAGRQTRHHGSAHRQSSPTQLANCASRMTLNRWARRTSYTPTPQLAPLQHAPLPVNWCEVHCAARDYAISCYYRSRPAAAMSARFTARSIRRRKPCR
jgi:hypothetical protein